MHERSNVNGTAVQVQCNVYPKMFLLLLFLGLKICKQSAESASPKRLTVKCYKLREVKQDHQRWGYSTVTHLEQPVYLAIWKDLNKKKRKEHRKNN